MSACASATGVSADARSGTSSTITTRARRASIAANSTAVVGPRQLDTLRRFADAPFGMGVVRSLAVIAVAGRLSSTTMLTAAAFLALETVSLAARRGR